MVVDTSVLIAVLFGEEDASGYLEMLASAPKLFMSSFTWFETCAVVEVRKGEKGLKRCAELVTDLGIDIIPFDTGQAEIAFDAWRRYRKGVPPARLNLGDCASYALARTLNRQLLYKGEDFSKTDIPPGLEG